MITSVLDSSAVLAVLKAERRSNAVEVLLHTGAIPVVNLAEIYTKLFEQGLSHHQAKEMIRNLGTSTADFTPADAIETGALRPLTRTQGLSLGDRACLATAKRLGVPAYTCDRQWEKLDRARTGVDVRIIR